MDAENKILGIIKRVGFGIRDTSHAMLWFDVYTSEASASLQCIPAAEAIRLIEKHGISDVKNLEGKPCWVRDEGALIRFIDFADI
jgi:hypothetical protein